MPSPSETKIEPDRQLAPGTSPCFVPVVFIRWDCLRMELVVKLCPGMGRSPLSAHLTGNVLQIVVDHEQSLFFFKDSAARVEPRVVSAKPRAEKSEGLIPRKELYSLRIAPSHCFISKTSRTLYYARRKI